MFLILVISSKLFSQCAQTINIYSFTYGGHTYEVVKELKSWNDAKACATQRGGYLVAIDSDDEKNYIMGQLMMSNAANISASYHPVTDGGGASYIWTGGSDAITEGVWYWQGSPLMSPFYNGQGTAGNGGGASVNGAYINWGCNSLCEPDNYFWQNDQDALGLAMGSWPYGYAGQWNDIDMNNTLFYIIEKDGGSTSCTTPNSLSALNVTTNSASVTWVSSAPNFSIQYKTTSGTSWITVPSNMSVVQLTNLSPNTSYDFQVKAICSSTPSDTSAWSSTGNFVTQNNTIVAQYNAANYHVYPNPVSNYLFIDGAETLKNGNIQILTIDGVVVKNIPLADDFVNKIDVTNLSNGIYFLNITTANSNVVYRFVKQ